MIRIPHPRIQGVFLCRYCRRILQKGVENKRGLCRTCFHKYHMKVKLTDFIKEDKK